MSVAASGGPPRPLTSPDSARGEITHGYPDVLPDGRTVLFTVGTGTGSRIEKLSLETGRREQLLADGAKPRFTSAGYLVFSEGSDLRRIRFDPRSARVTGPVTPVLDGVGWGSVAGLEYAVFDVSRRGDLAFASGGLRAFETRLVWVDRQGRESAVDADSAYYLAPRVSPDGARVAVIRPGELGIGEVWVMDADADGADYNPIWTPDGTRLTYTSKGQIVERPVDRDEAPRPILTREHYQFPRSWSPDGRFLAFMEVSPGGSRVWIMSRDGEPEPLLDGSFASGSPRFAPEGGWIAYVSDESGRYEVYVRRYPGSQRGQRISTGGGREPVWSANGRELFYREGNKMMAVTVSTEPELEVGDPVELWEAPYFSQEFLATNYDVAPDGRFLMLAVPEASRPEPMRVHVFLDWTAPP